MLPTRCARGTAAAAAVMLAALTTLVAAAEHEEGQLAPQLDLLGDYSYPVSVCSEAAQRFFDQGLRLYHGFYFPESVASFREAVRLDPNCTMARWGEALPSVPTPTAVTSASPTIHSVRGKWPSIWPWRKPSEPQTGNGA